MTGLASTDPATYHIQRTTVLLELHKYEQAAREVRRVLQRAPDRAEAHRLLAVALREQGKLAGARSAAERALQLAPEDADVHSTLALVLQRLGQDDKAQAHHHRAISLAPQVSAFHARFARFLLYKCASSQAWPRMLKTAQREIQTALELDPQNAAAHLIYAATLRVQRCFPQAEAAVREALALAPDNASAHEMLGDIHIDLNRGAEAFASFREALRLNPANNAVKRKVSLAMQAKLPVIRWFWRVGQQNSLGHRALWVGFTVMVLFLSCLTGWRVAGLAVAYVTFYTLIVLWGLFLWVVDPVITHGVIRGWIKV